MKTIILTVIATILFFGISYMIGEYLFYEMGSPMSLVLGVLSFFLIIVVVGAIYVTIDSLKW